MNGRLYDPYLQRFLSPDPYVQSPFNAQNYNRYAYCLNNPLMYTDPSGDLFLELGIFIVGSGILKGLFDGGGDGGHIDWGAFGKGFVQGATISATMVGSIYLPGLASATWSPFMTSLYMGGTTFASTAMTSGLMSWSYSGSFDVNWGAAAIAGGVAFTLTTLNYLDNMDNESLSYTNQCRERDIPRTVDELKEIGIKGGVQEGNNGVGEISMDIPSRYKYDNSSRMFINSKKQLVRGICRTRYFSPKSDIFIAPGVTLESEYSITSTLIHEETHALQNLNFMNILSPNKNLAEFGAKSRTLEYLFSLPPSDCINRLISINSPTIFEIYNARYYVPYKF